LTETHLILVIANNHNSRKDMAISKSGRVTFIYREMRIEMISHRRMSPLSPAKQHKHDTLIDQPDVALSRFHVSVPRKGGQKNSSDN
jgi:hypothetical protein